MIPWRRHKMEVILFTKQDARFIEDLPTCIHEWYSLRAYLPAPLEISNYHSQYSQHQVVLKRNERCKSWALLTVE